MAALPIGNLFHPQPGNIRAERNAGKSLERCRRKLGLTEIPLPVPVDQWIETVFDIGFGITDLSHLGADVLGAAMTRDDDDVSGLLARADALLYEAKRAGQNRVVREQEQAVPQ